MYNIIMIAPNKGCNSEPQQSDLVYKMAKKNIF